MTDLTVSQISLWKCLSAVSTNSTERKWLFSRLIRGTLKPRNKIMRILCVLIYLGENKVMQLRVTSPSGES